MDTDYLDQYRDQGFAVVRGVFSSDEIMELQAAFDRVYAQGAAHGRSFRDGNALFKISDDENLGPIMRIMQWPSYFEPVLNRFRLDPRMLEIVRPLIGDNLKQIINQMHWKPPGAAMAEFGYHQDIRSRRPRTAYRNPAESYVQTGIAVDPHRRENGAMTIIPASHKLGELPLARDCSIMDTGMSGTHLDPFGLDPASEIDLELDPGDVALWHVHTIHGSGPNASAIDRRLYINGYVTAENCDRGEWAFRDGAPCELGAPVLVHYEDLFKHPGPHYEDA
jgi:ectoine hydroxylase-related dioxygenase (phytanoyl-CoA dioxygenase family)